jgi:DNA polymerase I-like protein with 3'-5' exonuclease and polymerase domains
VFTLTGRLRAAAGFTARRNTVFQGLTSDGAKLALWRVWRAGFRVVNFVHDELLVEVPAGSDLTAHAGRVQTLMVEGMRAVLPDVRVGVEYAATARWAKGAKATFDANGRLTLSPSDGG